MSSLTLAIPTELKRKMEHFSELNWSEVARKAIQEKIAVLERMNELLKNSQFTEKETLDLGRVIKKKAWRKTKKHLHS